MKLEKLYKHPEASDEELFDLDLRTKIIVLLGKNGSGKTTMLQSIKESLRENYKVINDDPSGRGDNYLNVFDPKHIMHTRFSSEGEVLGYTTVQILLKVNLYKKQGQKIVLCLDKIDSGLSYNNIVDIANIIKNEVIKDVEYIILTANSYELASQFIGDKNSSFYWVETNEYISIDTYENFIERYKSVKG